MIAKRYDVSVWVCPAMFWDLLYLAGFLANTGITVSMRLSYRLSLAERPWMFSWWARMAEKDALHERRSYVTGSLCIIYIYIYLFCNRAMTPKPHWNGKSMPFLHATGCQHRSGWDGQLAKCEMCTDFGSRGDRHLVKIYPAVRWLYYSSWCGGRSPKWT